GTHFIVDEAHTTGCLGPAGSGLVDASKLRGRVLATVHTGGKALGVVGAYICGPRRLRELLINRCRHFVFTTALPPVISEWWLAALQRVQRDEAGRASLCRNVEVFRRELERRGVAVGGNDYIVPLVLGDDLRTMRVASELARRGWDIRGIRQPSV